MAAVSCPDCDGSFTVSALAGRLYFVGWIGHSYRLADALAAKEERLENRLWTVVTAVEELVALLKDLHARGGSLFARAEYGRRNEALRVLTDDFDGSSTRPFPSISEWSMRTPRRNPRNHDQR